MKKLNTYFSYLVEYLKHGDVVSVFSALKYLLFKKSHSKDRIIKTSVGLFFCRKNTNDFQFANFHYEWGVKKYILDNLDNYNVFIDGGACVGEYSILLSKYNVRCIAIEPVRSNFEVLCKNLELNHLSDKVIALPFGLGNQNTQVNFVYNPVNTGASHIACPRDRNDCTSEIRTFDSLLPDLKLEPTDHILFKLDVEGMELEAIQGAAQFIQDFNHITFIMEDKHSGKEKIVEVLNQKAKFEFGFVDEFNIYARKTKSKPPKN